MFYYSTDFMFNPTYIKNFTLVTFNDSKGVSCINGSSDTIFDLEKLMVTFAIKRKSNQNLAEFDQTIIQGKIDTCKIGEGMFGSYILTSLMADFTKYSNFQLTCPHKKGFLYLSNFPRVDESVFPSFVPKQKTLFELTVVCMAKLPKRPKLASFLSLKVYGIIFA